LFLPFVVQGNKNPHKKKKNPPQKGGWSFVLCRTVTQPCFQKELSCCYLFKIGRDLFLLVFFVPPFLLSCIIVVTEVLLPPTGPPKGQKLCPPPWVLLGFRRLFFFFFLRGVWFFLSLGWGKCGGGWVGVVLLFS